MYVCISYTKDVVPLSEGSCLPACPRASMRTEHFLTIFIYGKATSSSDADETNSLLCSRELGTDRPVLCDMSVRPTWDFNFVQVDAATGKYSSKEICNCTLCCPADNFSAAPHERKLMDLKCGWISQRSVVPDRARSVLHWGSSSHTDVLKRHVPRPQLVLRTSYN
jgi:hypothetical protein